MSLSLYILALFISFACGFAKEDQLSADLRLELDRLKAELQKVEALQREVHKLTKRLSKVDSLENEVEELRRVLEERETKRAHRSLLVPPVWSKCPNGTVQHDNSCYMVSHEVTNWPNALVYCEAYGGNLAVIESDREQQFITSHIQSVNPTATDPTHYYWIGGLDALTNNEWFWSKTAEPIKYTHWGPGEPDSSPTHKSGRQDCLALFSGGWWDDGWCEDEHNFICEIKLNEDSVLVG